MKYKIIINVKKLISVLLCSILISSTMPSSLLNSTVFAKGESYVTKSDQTQPSIKYKNKQDNKEHASANSCEKHVSTFDELQNAINNAQKGETILLDKDITIPKHRTLYIRRSKDITITSNCNTKTIKPDNSCKENRKYQVFYIQGSSTVNLKNITIDFASEEPDYSNINAIEVHNNSTLKINSGTTIKNSKFNSAIMCSGNSKVLLLAGNICNCDYNAINLQKKSSFQQTGGKISNCDRAIYSCDSTINQYHGEISNCGHSREGGVNIVYKTLLHPYGGAIYSKNSNITQAGGKISDCDAERGGAIYSKNSNIEQINVQISDCTATTCGGAIYLDEASSLENYSNGKISNCTAREDGGAIYSTESSSISLTNISIDSCKAKNGGAIYSTEIKFPSKDNFIKLRYSSIKNCSATSSTKIFCNPNKPIGGGAIYIDGFNTPKTKEADIVSSTIENCHSCRDGGAIITCGNSSLSFEGSSEIINCKLNDESIGKGNAIYTDHTAKLAIDAKCKIHFGDECKINTDKDNGKQKYKYEGIFDEKLDENISSKVDNNNTQPFKITSPDCYEVSSKNESKDFDTITVYGTGTPGYIVDIYLMKEDNTQQGIGTTIVDKKGNWKMPVSVVNKKEPLNLSFFYHEKDRNDTGVRKDKSIEFLKLHVLDRQKYWEDFWISKDFKAVVFRTDTPELGDSLRYRLFGINTYLHECSQIDTNYFLPKECCPGFGDTYYHWYDLSQEQSFPYVQYIDDISFKAIAKYDKSIVKDIAYLKTDKLYKSHTEIPKNANWITPKIKTTQLKNLIAFSKDTTNCTYIEPKIQLENGKLNDKFYIYARFKDIFNNIRYVRFDGACLIHKDIEVKEDKITKDNVTYERLTKKDKELDVTLNGNTLCGKGKITKDNVTYKEDKELIVRVIADEKGSVKEESLKKDSDYKIKDNKITITQNYFDKLKDKTDFYFTIYYHPAGKDTAHEAPHTIHISTKKPDKVTVTNYEHSNETSSTIYGTGKKGCLVSLTNENKEVIGTTMVDKNGRWQLTTSKLPKDINHKISIFQTDLEANTTSDPFEYIPGNTIITFNNLGPEYTYGDGPIPISLNGYSGNGDVTYKSSNTSVATIETIDNKKMLTIVGAGKFEITAMTNGHTLKKSGTIKVCPRPVTIRVSNGFLYPKYYDGTPDAYINKSYAKIENKLQKDDLRFEVTESYFNDKNVGQDKTVTVKFKLRGIDDDKYYLKNKEMTFKANIYQRRVIIEGLKAESKEYDGTNTATIINKSKAKIWGKLQNEDLSFDTKSWFNDKNVGKNKPVKIKFELTGEDKNNYVVDYRFQKNLRGNIYPKPLKIISPKVKDKLYDGNTKAEFEKTPTLQDFLKEEKVSLIKLLKKEKVSLKPGIPYFESAEPGKRHIQFSPDFELEGINKKNYIIDKSKLKDVFATIYYNLPTIKSPSLTKEDGNVKLSYQIEKGTFAINPKETKISLDGENFINLSKVNEEEKEIKINQSDDSTLSFTILKNGQHNIQIEIFDNKGHSVKSTPITIKIDKSKPNSVTVNNKGKYFVSKRPSISGTGEKGCKVTIKDENGNPPIGIAKVDNDGKWEITPTSDLLYGEHTLCISQTNQAGIQSDPIYHKIFIVELTMEIDNVKYSLDNSKVITGDTFINLKLLTNINPELLTNDQSKPKIYYSTGNSDWIPYNGRVVGIGLKKNETNCKKRIHAQVKDADGNTIEIKNLDIYFYTPISFKTKPNLLDCTDFAENAQPADKEIPVPMLRKPKRIGINSNVNESKIYLNSTKDKGVKTISAKGTPGCTIKIKTQENNKEIGSSIVSDRGKCDIKLNDEFNKLENGKEYPVSICQEDNSSKEKKSDSLDVKLCILNTPPTIKLFDKDGKEIQKDPIPFPYALDCLKIEAKDAAGKEIEEGNLEIFAKENEEANEEELNNSENWKLFNGLWDLIRDKGNNQKTIYIYIKAKDKAGNIDYRKNIQAKLYTPTTTK